MYRQKALLKKTYFLIFTKLTASIVPISDSIEKNSQISLFN